MHLVIDLQSFAKEKFSKLSVHINLCKDQNDIAIIHPIRVLIFLAFFSHSNFETIASSF
jgi:hypothetical protein